MSDIRVERKHALGKAKALESALRVAERLKDKAQIDYAIRGDVIELSRSGAKGRIVVSEDSVVAEVTLSFLVRPMRALIESKIADYFARYLG